MTVARGDVVIIGFPQPGGRPKRRPALVIQSDHNNSRLANSIFAMITSNTRLATVEQTQVLIDLTTPDGQQSGLAQTSAVKSENVFTLPQSCVVKAIGTLPGSLMAEVDNALKASLSLA